MYYKWIGMFTRIVGKGALAQVTTLRMCVTARRYADEMVNEKVNKLAQEGWVLESGRMIRTDHNYRPL